MAHYGLYPDWIQDLKMLAGNDIVKDMARGPEAYLQMWERAYGVKPNACTNPELEAVAADDHARGSRPGMTVVADAAGRRPAGPPPGQHVQLLLRSAARRR